jgi:biotin carboxylase
MRCVLLIAPHNSYRIHAYIEAALHLDIQLIVASQSEHSLVSAVAAGVQIDFQNEQNSLERILAAHKEYRFKAVIAADDSAVSLAALVAQALGLSANTPESALITQRKDLTRERLKVHKIPTPAFRLIKLDESIEPQLLGLDYPVVVKPVSMSGSRGVIRADNLQACVEACERIRPIISFQGSQFERNRVLVETYISGEEVAFEGLLHQGKLTTLTIFDKPEPMEGLYFEESYYVTPSSHSRRWQEKIKQRVAEVCRAFGLHEGPIHAELRLCDDEAWLIEIASRTIGGDCADMLKFGLNIGLEELVLLQALGKPVELPEMKESVGVLMIPIPSQGILRRVEGLTQAKAVEYVTDVGISVREGYELVPLPEGQSYLGFIFAKAPTADLVECALRAAHKKLTIKVAPVFKLIKE